MVNSDRMRNYIVGKVTRVVWSSPKLQEPSWWTCDHRSIALTGISRIQEMVLSYKLVRTWWRHDAYFSRDTVLLQSWFVESHGKCLPRPNPDIKKRRHLKRQLGVPLTVYIWHLLCSLGSLGDFFTHKYQRYRAHTGISHRGTLGSGYIQLSPEHFLKSWLVNLPPLTYPPKK